MYDYSVPEILDRLNGNSGAQGFNRWFGLKGLAAGNGQVEIEVPIRDDMRQHHGYVHGGCIGALADMACAWAGSANGGGIDVVTSSFTVHFLRPATGETMRARARTIRKGKSVATVEADIFVETEGEEPRLCATALASIAILPDARPRIR
ncbi:hotdog fold thioesterase [Pseudooceanicola sp. 216_PA32_1]|uniref:Hotdog fold thioesterase n=1 Tax=Pseudooceanicola pacificus TaxID=2676438 RepID=A0A844W0G8_9RHOB|nr:PaaI family thioesterase [Pseudooceanicola pacificus]MWB77217.1 hotdog fold thioesterase [Pseudooceanicola pacificus]